jgi:hypothetical protein
MYLPMMVVRCPAALSLEAMFSSSQPSLLNLVMLPLGGKFVSTLWLWA